MDGLEFFREARLSNDRCLITHRAGPIVGAI